MGLSLVWFLLFLGEGVIAVMSTTALFIGASRLLSTDESKIAKTVDNPVETFRAACMVCGAHQVFRSLKPDSSYVLPESDEPGSSKR